MTDEERQKLCEGLRRKAESGPVRVPICSEAADEIERLVKRNIKLETALDRIEAICKHGPDSSEALPDTLPDKRWGFPNESD